MLALLAFGLRRFAADFVSLGFQQRANEIMKGSSSATRSLGT